MAIWQFPLPNDQMMRIEFAHHPSVRELEFAIKVLQLAITHVQEDESAERASENDTPEPTPDEPTRQFKVVQSTPRLFRRRYYTEKEKQIILDWFASLDHPATLKEMIEMAEAHGFNRNTIFTYKRKHEMSRNAH